MAALFSTNAQAVIRFLQANTGEKHTADDIAEALGLTPRQVNGTVTGLQKKGITERVEVEGFEKKVNSDRVVGEGEDLGDFLAPELDGEDAIIVADALGHAGTEDFLLRHFEKLVLERAAARIDCHAFCHNWFDSPCLPKREEFIR